MFARKGSMWISAMAAPLAAVMLSGCVPGMSNSTAAGQAGAGRVVTDPGAMGKTRIRVLDYFAGGPDKAWMERIVTAFERKYPQITVDRTAQSWDDVMKSLPLKLRSADPPDIVPANNGWQSLGTLAKGGLVLNLDPYAEAYGWKKAFPTSIQEEHQFAPDGKEMGTGSLFGAPIARGSAVEVYYNRSLLKRTGGHVPRTLTQFEENMRKAKAAGITPVAVGNLEQGGVTATLFSLINSFGDRDKIADFTYSRGDMSVGRTGFPEAVTKLKEWAGKGYFTKDFAAVPGQDAAQAFVDGKALFRFDYSGSLPLQQGDSKKLGSFVLPRAHGGDPVVTFAAASNFSIAAKTKHPDAAAAFLNFMASPEAARIATQVGSMPMLSTPELPPDHDPLLADDVKIAAQVSDNDSAVPYLDWATPTLLNTMTTHMTDLLAGKASAADVVKATQDDYAQFQKTRKAK
ncbi:ABC transporter substrate-binding protein [Streptomyces sp. NPDC055105]|uniref:ABC transporter substrate-binding protein n=1 Tax=Streptomyces sp. NPDC055105 TaxID=3365719 RepID=UPI0037D7E67C